MQKKRTQRKLKIKGNISEIEKHCNNYFNPENIPENPERNHPAEFLELCERIRAFREQNAPSNVVHESVVGLHTRVFAKNSDGVTAGWQTIFSRELAMYKRARFV